MKNIILTHSLSAEGTIRKFLINSGLSSNTSVVGTFDDFSHGPIETTETARDFIRTRVDYWKTIDLFDNPRFSETDTSSAYVEEFLNILRSDFVEFWTTGTVQETFFITVYVSLLLLENFDPGSIAIREFSSDKRLWGLGVLKEEEISELYSQCNAEKIDASSYAKAWKALSSGSSDAVSKFAEGQGGKSILGNAFKAYALRFPECNGGVGSIDRRLLMAGSEEMRKSAHTIGRAMAAGGVDERDYVGDLFLFRRLVELSQAPRPWFELVGDLSTMRTSSAKLTTEGRAIRDQL
ncbi:MAG: DUF1835 domain-containing protein [Cognatishimia sp.]|uniref:DUF1835 domain-containing protein n=1 Tax=Cognatishimia sp. TaxID=2211648 RepID=UPI003B8D144A